MNYNRVNVRSAALMPIPVNDVRRNKLICLSSLLIAVEQQRHLIEPYGSAMRKARRKLSPQPIGYDWTYVSAARFWGVLRNAMKIPVCAQEIDSVLSTEEGSRSC